MAGLPFLLAAFAVVYACFDLTPSFLTHDLGGRLTSGDALSLLMPLAVLPLLWLVLLRLASGAPQPRRRIAVTLLAVASIIMADGHGMNLAANAVGRHLVGHEGTGAWVLAHFFDETLGHLGAHGGLVLATWSWLLAADGVETEPTPWWTLVAGMLLGFAWFADGVEGQTVMLMLPGAAVGALWAGVSTRRGVRGFLLATYLTALLLFAVWGVWHRGFPEFSALGWI